MFKLKSLKQKNKGFTIIELLLVVAIISILSGVTLTVLNATELRKRPRDSQRVADLGHIQTALELYFADNRGYPSSGTFSRPATALGVLTSGGYISVVPSDPLDTQVGTSPCDAGASGYFYRTNNASPSMSSQYVLVAVTERPETALTSPCTTLSLWGSLGCTGGSVSSSPAMCYGVQNP